MDYGVLEKYFSGMQEFILAKNTLTNQVAFERGISYRDSYYRYTMFINGIAVPNPNPIYGMYPFEYSKGKAAVMRYLEYGIDIYERYLYFRN